MKKVFTKVFSGGLAVSGAQEIEKNAMVSWLAQEDIEVVAAQISLKSTQPSENDGFASVVLELSQVGVLGLDGAILVAQAGEGWNTTPAGICETNADVVLALPSGLTVPVKEEGYLFLNAMTRGKSAGMSVFGYQAIIFYTKGRSR
ncbi:hypothetical protein ES708_29413 [subsurface metagenome]